MKSLAGVVPLVDVAAVLQPSLASRPVPRDRRPHRHQRVLTPLSQLVVVIRSERSILRRDLLITLLPDRYGIVP